MRTRSSRRLAALGLTGLVLLAGGVSACGDKAGDTKAAGPVELLQACASACARLKQQVGRIVIGQEQVVDNMLVALLGLMEKRLPR